MRTIAGALRAAFRTAEPGPASLVPVDRVVAAFGASNPRATFVQVGSNDGVRRDPLREPLRAYDWRGVMVEPIPYAFERLRGLYGDDLRIQLANVAIADEDGTRTMYYLREDPDAGDDLPDWYDSIGSFYEDVVLRHRGDIPDIESRIATLEVPCVTFETLCRRAGLDRVDLVHIDAEGHDDAILRGIDLARVCPKLVIFEHFHLDRPRYAACVARLESLGFECVSIGMDTMCLGIRSPGRRDRTLRRMWDQIRREPAEVVFKLELT